MADETLSYRYTKKNFWRWPSRSLLPVPRPAKKREAEDARRPNSAANSRSAAAAMLIAFALFMLFESEGARHFTRNLPGNAVTDVMVHAADRWHELMVRLGPARLAPAIRDGFERLREVSW